MFVDYCVPRNMINFGIRLFTPVKERRTSFINPFIHLSVGILHADGAQ
jgi:hypothetical protein